MPCDCSHLEPDRYEVEGGRINLLLKELDGTPFAPSEYKTAFEYNVYENELSRRTRELCSRLKKLKPKVISDFSLELQIWWRDHQEADAQKESE